MHISVAPRKVPETPDITRLQTSANASTSLCDMDSSRDIDAVIRDGESASLLARLVDSRKTQWCPGVLTRMLTDRSLSPRYGEWPRVVAMIVFPIMARVRGDGIRLLAVNALPRSARHPGCLSIPKMVVCPTSGALPQPAQRGPSGGIPTPQAYTCTIVCKCMLYMRCT